jgi:signal transduction histidine kinase
MGLGLAITKNIIERFNGTISFETNEAETVFYVELPKHS